MNSIPNVARFAFVLYSRDCLASLWLVASVLCRWVTSLSTSRSLTYRALLSSTKNLIVRDRVECEPRACSCDYRTIAGNPCAPDYILRVNASLYSSGGFWDKTQIGESCLRDDLFICSSNSYPRGRCWPHEIEKTLEAVTTDDPPNLTKFLHSKGILTNLTQLLSTNKATTSLDENVLRALNIMRHLPQNKHLYQTLSHPLSGWVQNFTTQHPSSQHHKIRYSSIFEDEPWRRVTGKIGKFSYRDSRCWNMMSWNCRIFWVFGLETAAFWTLTDDGIAK